LYLLAFAEDDLMAPDKIAKDVVVELQYKLRLDDGTLVEESTLDDPLVYLHGHDNIIPGLERQLEGMRAGEKKTVTVEPEEAYGEYNEDDIGRISLNEIPADFEPEIGMLLPVIDDEGNEDEVEIVEIEDDAIIVDFNHPLAGEQLEFEVEITGLRAADSEELDHGHVHEDGNR
jgi:FKBP-type peptidyl-prolyl cis-trans isomerase SlyD